MSDGETSGGINKMRNLFRQQMDNMTNLFRAGRMPHEEYMPDTTVDPA